MAKIPTILEAGRADGKLIKTDSIYDDNQEKFLSNKLKELDNNHNSLNNIVNNNKLDIENKLETEKNRATTAENNLRETINNITKVNENATSANIVTVNTIPNTSSSNVQQALNELYEVKANTSAIQSIKDKGAVEVYFSLNDLEVTDTTIYFVQFSFVYIKDLVSNKYVRYIIKTGKYDLPNSANRCLYVSPSIKDENGFLIPTISEGEINATQTNCYILGICDNGGKFMLTDAASVYKANKSNVHTIDTKTTTAIEKEIARAKAAEETNTQAISNEIQARIKIDEQLNTIIEAEKNRAEAAEEVLNGKINAQKNEINVAKEEALQAISENEQSAITNFNSQRVTPEMLSESTKQLIEASGSGTITNLADDEDIESRENEVGVSVLKFANKDYNPTNFSGKGSTILRRNIIEDKNVLTQENFSASNMIYLIKYDFDLNGQIINIPKGCVLKFEGGSLKNGTLNGSNTKVENTSNTFIFYNVILGGTFIDNCYSSWFYNTFDDTDNILWESLLTFESANINSELKYLNSENLSSRIRIAKKTFKLNGNNNTIKYKLTDNSNSHYILFCYNMENLIIENIRFEQINEYVYGEAPMAFWIINVHTGVKNVFIQNVQSINANERFLTIYAEVEKTTLVNCKLHHNNFAIEGFGKDLIIKESYLTIIDGNSRYGGDILSSGSSEFEKVSVYNSTIIGGIEHTCGAFYAYNSILSVPSIGNRGGTIELDEAIFNNCNFIGCGDIFVDKFYRKVNLVHNCIFNNCVINCPSKYSNTDWESFSFYGISNLEFNLCDIVMFEVSNTSYWKPAFKAQKCENIQFSGCRLINGSGKDKKLIVVLENEEYQLPNIKSKQLSLVDENIIFNVGINQKIPTEIFNEHFRLMSNIPKFNMQGTFDKRPTSNINIGQTYFCTDRQTTEGATNGIMIYYKGDDVWVDALGRVVS